jgi:8-oxo-dGTP pyrophosphatase MutT (NUDIX family)
MVERCRECAAAILVSVCGRLLLQQRDDIPGILYPGLIGLFGGHRESPESFLECVQREVQEEIGYQLALTSIEPFFQSTVHYANGFTVITGFFIGRDVPTERLRVTEGKLVLVKTDELSGILHRMTPLAGLGATMFVHGTH